MYLQEEEEDDDDEEAEYERNVQRAFQILLPNLRTHKRRAFPTAASDSSIHSSPRV